MPLVAHARVSIARLKSAVSGQFNYNRPRSGNAISVLGRTRWIDSILGQSRCLEKRFPSLVTTAVIMT